MKRNDSLKEEYILLSSARSSAKNSVLHSTTLELSEQQNVLFDVFMRHLSHEFDPNATISTGLYFAPVSLLFLALDLGCFALARMLIDKKANVNEKLALSGLRGNKISLLHYFSFSNTGFEAAKLLLEMGAEVNMQDRNGWTPLHLAAYKGHKNLVLLLLSMGANARVRDVLGEEPLDKALRSHQADILEMLRFKGGVQTLSPPKGNPPAGTVYNYNLRVSFVGASGVGKSSLLSHFINDKAPDPRTIQPTGASVDVVSKLFRFESISAQLTLYDGSGEERYLGLRPVHCMLANIIFVIYDVTDACSFLKAQRWVNELLCGVPPTVIFMLVGNKADLGDARQVSLLEADNYAKDYRMVNFDTTIYEPSRTCCRVQELFIVALQMYHQHVGKYGTATKATTALPTPICRVIDLHYGKRLDYKHSLKAQTLLGNPFHTGWLTKKGHWVQSWRRRFFILKDIFLYYYRTEQDPNPSGIIPIKLCSVTRQNGQMTIVTAPSPHSKSHAEYVIAAESARELDQWIAAIDNAKLFAQQLRTSIPAVVSWLPITKTIITDCKYTAIDYQIGVEGEALVLASIGLPAAETFSQKLPIGRSIKVLRNPRNRSELLLTDDFGLRLMISDPSPHDAVLSFLRRVLPSFTTYGTMSPADCFLNFCLSYLYSTERMNFPVLKPLLDQLAWFVRRDKDTEDVPADEELTKISLSSNPLASQDIDALMHALSYYPYCTTLELQDIDVSEYSFEILMGELIENSSITNLDISENSFAVATFANSIGHMLNRNKSLVTLKVASVKLGNAGAAPILDALTANRTLTALDLSRNQLDDKAVSSLCKCLEGNRVIHSLDLRHNFFTEAICIPLLGALQKNSSLQVLELEGNKFNPLYLAQLDALLRSRRRSTAPLSRGL